MSVTEARAVAATAPAERLLAFDTATETLSVALLANGRSACIDGDGGALASQRLLPCIRQLLADAGVTLQQLQAIGFGRGPGAFTGLRTACAVAQGLAFGAALPVLPVDSLLIVAEDARMAVADDGDRAIDIDVVMDARMGEVYAATYRWAGGRWTAAVPPALSTLDALHAQWAKRAPQVVAGTALGAFGDALQTAGARRIAESRSRSAALLRLAQQQWRTGAGVAAADALPLYLRDKVALTTAQRAQAAPA